MSRTAIAPRGTALKGTISKSRYNPNAIRRRVRLVEITSSRIALFASYSMTRESREVKHDIEIDLQTGEARCSCEHFRFKCARRGVTIQNAAEKGCKHIQRAVETLKRRDLVTVKLGPADSVRIAPATASNNPAARDTREVKCPKCPAPLGTLGGEAYCFACGEFINC